jgi:hypothetical protein
MMWEKVPGKQAWFTDVPGVGRYLVAWGKSGGRQYAARLNGKLTTYAAARADDVKAMVEQRCALLVTQEKRDDDG